MRRASTAIAAAALLALAGAAGAGGFGLSPVGLSIAPNQASAAVYAQNTGAEPIVIQVRTFAWTQDDGRDSRAATRELIVNPTVFRLAPGERQLVRFASRSGPPKTIERAYRAVFTEVPPTAEPDKPLFGARVLIAQDIPIYVEPASGRAACAPEWRAERAGAQVKVEAVNRGDAHCRLLNVRFGVDDKPLQQRPHLVLLAQSRVELEMSVPPGATSLRMSAEQGSNGAEQPIAVDIAMPVSR